MQISLFSCPVEFLKLKKKSSRGPQGHNIQDTHVCLWSLIILDPVSVFRHRSTVIFSRVVVREGVQDSVTIQRIECYTYSDFQTQILFGNWKSVKLREMRLTPWRLSRDMACLCASHNVAFLTSLELLVMAARKQERKHSLTWGPALVKENESVSVTD